MATVEIPEKLLREYVDASLMAGADVAVRKIGEVTPRDLKRLPKSINRKDGKAPQRKWGVVMIGGNYYTGVTGILKDSIKHEKAGDLKHDVGVLQWPASPYARAQEFGTVRIPPRPYVRKGFFENIDDIIRMAQFTFSRLTK